MQNLIYTDDGNCLKIAGFENMVGSETTWAKEKREKKKLLGGHCPENVLTEIDIELDGWKDRLYIMNLELNKINLVQNVTTEYNEIFKQKNIYFENINVLPENLLKQIKIYQLAVKQLCDNRQLELLNKVSLPILKKVFGNILKNKGIANIEEYYISSLINELISTTTVSTGQVLLKLKLFQT